MFKDTVLICQGCHNNVPQTGWLTQQKFIVSQFWKLEGQDQVPAWSGSGESPLLGCKLLSSCCILTQQKGGKRALWSPFYKGTNPIHEGSTLLTCLPAKALPSNTVILGFLHMNSVGDTNSLLPSKIFSTVAYAQEQRFTLDPNQSPFFIFSH